MRQRHCIDRYSGPNDGESRIYFTGKSVCVGGYLLIILVLNWSVWRALSLKNESGAMEKAKLISDLAAPTSGN